VENCTRHRFRESCLVKPQSLIFSTDYAKHDYRLGTEHAGILDTQFGSILQLDKTSGQAIHKQVLRNFFRFLCRGAASEAVAQREWCLKASFPRNKNHANFEVFKYQNNDPRLFLTFQILRDCGYCKNSFRNGKSHISGTHVNEELCADKLKSIFQRFNDARSYFLRSIEK